ncbi:MAG: hypothetical protein ABW328_03105 [Ilumatobacteraceae bacterium]
MRGLSPLPVAAAPDQLRVVGPEGRFEPVDLDVDVLSAHRHPLRHDTRLVRRSGLRRHRHLGGKGLDIGTLRAQIACRFGRGRQPGRARRRGAPASPAAASPGLAVRDVFRALVSTSESELPTLLLRKRVIAATPSLHSRAVERRHMWEASVVEELRDRYGRDAGTTLALRVTVAAVTAAFHVALEIWIESDGRRDLAALVADAMDILADGTARTVSLASAGRPAARR